MMLTLLVKEGLFVVHCLKKPKRGPRNLHITQTTLCNLCEDRSSGCESIADFLQGASNNLRGGQSDL